MASAAPSMASDSRRFPAYVANAMVVSGIRRIRHACFPPSFDSAVYKTMAPGTERAVRTSEIAPATSQNKAFSRRSLTISRPDHREPRARAARGRNPDGPRNRARLPGSRRGAKGRDKRPQFDMLCKDATNRKFDVVMAWSVDRLGRSLQDLVGFLTEIHALKVDLYLHQQGIDTTTPAGKAMFQMMGVFAEFERAMIQERVRAGLARARDEGKTLGRPKIAPATEKAIRAALANGDEGMHKIATRFRVGTGTVQRIKAEMVG
jgi:Resolvase, N terminal domain